MHVAIFPDHRRFLRFCVNNKHYQFKALPFGLSTAPRVFTKILVNLVVALRQRGIHLHPYLDNLLLWAPSCSLALAHITETINYLRCHGFMINMSKSRLQPTQRLKHLGVVIDTVSCQFFLPHEKITKTTTEVSRAVKNRSSLLMSLASLLGLLVANAEALQWGRFHLRGLQGFLQPFQHRITIRQHLPLSQ